MTACEGIVEGGKKREENLMYPEKSVSICEKAAWRLFVVW
jgi:hypothetical protein